MAGGLFLVVVMSKVPSSDFLALMTVSKYIDVFFDLRLVGPGQTALLLTCVCAVFEAQVMLTPAGLPCYSRVCGLSLRQGSY